MLNLEFCLEGLKIASRGTSCGNSNGNGLKHATFAPYLKFITLEFCHIKILTFSFLGNRAKIETHIMMTQNCHVFLTLVF